jgi:hypothetical protein
MTVFNRIGVLLLATIVCAFCLELAERFEIPGVHGSSQPYKLSSAAP